MTNLYRMRYDCSCSVFCKCNAQRAVCRIGYKAHIKAIYRNPAYISKQILEPCKYLMQSTSVIFTYLSIYTHVTYIALYTAGVQQIKEKANVWIVIDAWILVYLI